MYNITGENIILGIVIMFFALYLLAIGTKSYLFAILSTIGLMSQNSHYDLGGMSQFLTVILAFTVMRFIRKRKQIEKEEQAIYESGRESARWFRIFNQGFDDEYED